MRAARTLAVAAKLDSKKAIARGGSPRNRGGAATPAAGGDEDPLTALMAEAAAQMAAEQQKEILREVQQILHASVHQLNSPLSAMRTLSKFLLRRLEPRHSHPNHSHPHHSDPHHSDLDHSTTTTRCSQPAPIHLSQIPLLCRLDPDDSTNREIVRDILLQAEYMDDLIQPLDRLAAQLPSAATSALTTSGEVGPGWGLDECDGNGGTKDCIIEAYGGVLLPRPV